MNQDEKKHTACTEGCIIQAQEKISMMTIMIKMAAPDSAAWERNYMTICQKDVTSNAQERRWEDPERERGTMQTSNHRSQSLSIAVKSRFFEAARHPGFGYLNPDANLLAIPPFRLSWVTKTSNSAQLLEWTWSRAISILACLELQDLYVASGSGPF
jgi:hypothetical protein